MTSVRKTFIPGDAGLSCNPGSNDAECQVQRSMAVLALGGHVGSLAQATWDYNIDICSP